ncbi:MAG: prolipoprotein diacylglyceryl transferase [Deltaproteobacteria bacterium]|nr:prolipoprotein diacylglyceryl transferase [Deltaproteobacteria bacterium]
MYPILFKIPLFGLFGHDSFPVHSYGVLVAFGFIFGTLFIQRAAKREGVDPVKALDLIFYILIAAILGSRILYVWTAEREQFFQNPLILFKIWEGGLVFYGGFIASVLVGIWYVKKHQLSLWKVFDLFSPAVALGHAIGRLGCYFSGCCYGRPLLQETWYSIVFPPNPGSLAPPGIPLSPTQLIDSGGEFVIFLALAWLLKHKKFDGQIFSLYLIGYAVLRFVNEMLRGDVERGFVFQTEISTSQFIAMILFAIGVALYIYKRAQRKGSTT